MGEALYKKQYKTRLVLNIKHNCERCKAIAERYNVNAGEYQKEARLFADECQCNKKEEERKFTPHEMDIIKMLIAGNEMD